MAEADFVEIEQAIVSIEAALEGKFSGHWRKLTLEELKRQPSRLGICLGWKLELPPQSVIAPGVTHLLLLIDPQFPHSQPRVIAPQVPNLTWPHIEWDGVLCLLKSKSTAAPGLRMLDHVEWALELLNMPEDTQRLHFQREFATYWSYNIPASQKNISAISILKPEGPSRDVVIYFGLETGIIVAAEDVSALRSWLKNRGLKFLESDIRPSWVQWVSPTWTPFEYPKTGGDVMKLIPPDVSSNILSAARPCPVLFATKTPTGVVIVSSILWGATLKSLRKGFRNLARVPIKRVIDSYRQRSVQNCKVHRADPAWVHSRDYGRAFRDISKRKVAIVGCGSLGGSIARLLAQAGISEFVLVDNDHLETHNTARHVLGQRFAGLNKAVGLASMLQQDFPHLRKSIPIGKQFEFLDDFERKSVSDCDLIVTAGVTYDCDIILDEWRRSLSESPIHICTWAEAFALAGHAVALMGKDSITKAFDVNENVKFRLTDWPVGSDAFVIEAGCGDVFQPHGAVEIQSTVSLAAGLALDALSDKLKTSVRRVWMGNRADVSARGGTALATFLESYCVKEFPWT